MPDGGFLARGSGFSAYLHRDGIVLRTQHHDTRLVFEGASRGVVLEGVDEAQGKANFLFGSDPRHWQTGLPMYSRVLYRGLYADIDMFYGGTGRRLKSEFVVHPGADPTLIRWRVEGHDRISIESDGTLTVSTRGGEFREEAPAVYQWRDGVQEPVEAAFRLIDASTIGFDVGTWDRSRALVIDPVLTYSTYYGGGGGDSATGIAVDGSGNAYVAGWTESADFPVVGPRQGFGGSVDAFVFKLTASGTAVAYATYVGGNRDDRAFGIAVDTSGNALLTGWTSSTNFPVTTAAQGAMAGVRDAFVLKLNPAGNALVYSTFLGGSAADSGNAIAVDSAGNAYVAGETASSNFPRLNPFQTSSRGRLEAFVAKYSAAGALQYSSFHGGAGDDRALGVAVDSSGASYLTGVTDSTNLTTVAPVQPLSGGGQDAFVAKVSATGASLVYATYLGGSGGGAGAPEAGYAIQVDSVGNAYIAGATGSLNFPLTAPAQAAFGGGGVDGFVVKLNSAGTARLYSTYLGGGSADFATAIRVSAAGLAFVSGYTASPNFPLASPTQSALAGGYDAFVTQLDAAGSSIPFSTYLGGGNSDGATSIALDSANNMYVAGITQSTNFPLVAPVRSSNSGNADAFVAKLSSSVTGNQPPSVLSVTPSSGTGLSQTFSFVFTDPDGVANLNLAEVLFNATLNTSGACWIEYRVANNELRLMNDAGSTALGPVTPGGASTLANSQCTLNAASSSATQSGATLTLNLAITFSTPFAGAKSVFLSATDVGGLLAAWLQRGTWTVPGGGGGAGAPSAASILPTLGNFSSQTFTVVATDPNGAADINFVEVLFNAGPATSLGCFVRYERATNMLRLYANNGTTLLAPVAAGAPAAVENSQCVINAFGSSASTAGNNLTVNIAVVFRTSFSGPRQSFVQIQDNGGLRLNFVQVGSWSVPSGNQAPVSLFVTPAAGSGSSQSFTYASADPNGVSDITFAQLLLRDVLTTVNACNVQYTPASNQLRLLDDAGTTALGPLTPGATGTVQNSQCVLTASGSSVSSLSAILNVTVSLSFKAPFAGGKTVFLNTTDAGGLLSDWQPRGSWTVPSTGTLVPPSGMTISPSSGAGGSQTFSIVTTDPNGQQDIARVEALFNGSLNTAQACYVRYERPTNSLSLFDDAGTTAVATAVIGSASALQNSQCVVNAFASSVSGSGNNLTVNLAILFRSSFAGALLAFGQARDTLDLTLAFTQIGAWTVPATNPAPAQLFVTPNTGSGSQQSFSFVFADPNGASDIFLSQVLFNNVLNTNSGCWIQFYQSTNELRLINDNSSAFFGPITPGGGSSIQNSQCILLGSGSAVSSNGALLTVTLNVFFKPGFSGGRNVYATVRDNAFLFSDWIALGTWSVPAGAAPSGVSLSPGSGSGTVGSFTLTATDSNGGLDISQVELLFNTGLTFSGACWVRYDRGLDTITLLNDAGTSAVGSATPGTLATLQNSQCIVNVADSMVTSGGDSLALTVALAFRSSFAGSRQAFAQVQDAGGLVLSWQQAGAWTVPSGNQPPVSLLVNPGSGTGPSQTFSLVVADPNGSLDVAVVNMIMNSTLNSLNACWVQYFRSTNELRLLADNISSFHGPLSPGGAGSVQNSQCILDAAGSSATFNGGLLTVNLALTLKTSFSGLRTLHVSVTDNGGLVFNFQPEGTWNVPSGVTPITPTAVSVTPAAGSGSSQTFSLVFSDGNGATDLGVVQVIVNNTLNSLNSCWVQYYRTLNQLRLLSDNISSFFGPLTPGGAGTAQNSQCILNAAGSSVSISGTTLTLNLSITFRPGFSGVKGVFLNATDLGNLTSGFQQRGSWTVP